MVAVAEAERLIQEILISPLTHTVEMAASLGHTLGNPIFADRDLPPYPRVAMDGIALFWAGDPLAFEYRIEHLHAAGDLPYALRDRSACVEVMTGSVLPEGTNTIIPYEDLRIRNGVAQVQREPRMGQHIHLQGADIRQGELLLDTGTVIGPKTVAVLAAVGITRVPVFLIPPVAIVSTGNELVDINAEPAPHQIRSSNNHALAAALTELKIGSELYHLPDRAEAMQSILPKILKQHAILILSGGVSKGKFDLIPAALEAHGVQKVFHQIQQKPGKPFWFGRSAQNTVFALPGNPVSTFLCFHRYIRPWLERCLQHKTKTDTARLVEPVTFNPSLTFFLQVKIREENGITVAQPVAGGGSGDFVNLLQAGGFLELPSDRMEFHAGEVFPLIRFR